MESDSGIIKVVVSKDVPIDGAHRVQMEASGLLLTTHRRIGFAGVYHPSVTRVRIEGGRSEIEKIYSRIQNLGEQAVILRDQRSKIPLAVAYYVDDKNKDVLQTALAAIAHHTVSW